MGRPIDPFFVLSIPFPLFPLFCTPLPVHFFSTKRVAFPPPANFSPSCSSRHVFFNCCRPGFFLHIPLFSLLRLFFLPSSLPFLCLESHGRPAPPALHATLHSAVKRVLRPPPRRRVLSPFLLKSSFRFFCGFFGGWLLIEMLMGTSSPRPGFFASQLLCGPVTLFSSCHFWFSVSSWTLVSLRFFKLSYALFDARVRNALSEWSISLHTTPFFFRAWT